MKKDKINKKDAATKVKADGAVTDAVSEKDPEAYQEPAIPLFLCLVCMAIILVVTVIDAFVYPFGNALLAPVILEVLAIVFPCYLILLTVYPKKSVTDQFKCIGFCKISVRYMFFILFSALFLMVAETLISVIFGGVYSAADGLTLLGVFTAGDGDYTSTVPYLILAYAVVPAVAEELLLRGMVFSQLKGIGFAAASVISALLSGFLGFSAGGFLPAVFSALVLCFVLYTTGSLWACMIVHLLFNVYRLLLEVNISAYYVASASRGLLLVVMFAAVLIFGALFFGESAKVYRENAEQVENGEIESRSLALRQFIPDIKKTVSYRTSVLLFAMCAVIFIAVTVIGYLT